MKKLIDRRKFFGIAGLTAIGGALLSKTPFKFIDRSNRFLINKKVELHPDAVKRTK